MLKDIRETQKGVDGKKDSLCMWFEGPPRAAVLEFNPHGEGGTRVETQSEYGVFRGGGFGSDED